MEFVSDFFYGLDAPVSTAFLGILLTAFLIGLLPAGLIYGSRLRDARRKLERHIAQQKRTLQERNMLEGHLERERATTHELQQRLRTAHTASASAQAQLTQTRDALSGAQGEAMAATVELTGLRDHAATLEQDVSLLKAKLQAARNAQRPMAAAPALDANVLASMKASRTKIDHLEARVDELMRDNEDLRRQLARRMA